MAKISTNALVLWLVMALSIVGFVAGFNIGVDPFGYFGTNTIGYYFSSERQFKYNLVKSFDYNAILLGDSRIAFTDPAYIKIPGLRFVNGGIGGASLAEQVALLSASQLDRLRLVVFGVHYRDVKDCTEEPAARESWDVLRFADSWTQLRYAIQAVMFRAQGKAPKYHPDGTRSVTSRYFEESVLEAKTARYWRKIKNDVPEDPNAEPNFELGAKCRDLLRTARELADRHGFALILVFLPRNNDLLVRLNWGTPHARSEIGRLVAQVTEAVPHTIDLSASSFSDSRNFWLNDSTHFKPPVGGRIIETAIKQSVGVQESK